MTRLILLPRAEIDVVETALWYESERHGLGSQFQADLDRLFSRMATGPRQFPELEPGVRRALMGRFPYGVYFVSEDEDCVVFAILHLHRHPDTWRDR